jgi:protein TonB
VTPSYPVELQQQGIEGAVVLEGIVSGDGSVRDMRVLRAAHAQLAEALIDAVERWRYTPTLLNCEPIEVAVTVTANFGLRTAR